MFDYATHPPAPPFRGAAGGRGPGQSPAPNAASNPQIC